MSYNVARHTEPQIAILSFSSAGAGLVTFADVNGQFSISGVGSNVLTLDAGYEYFITSSPATTSATAATFYHVVDGVNGRSDSIVATSFTSGLDQKTSSIQADASVTFSLNCSQATSSNSRLEIWRTSK